MILHYGPAKVEGGQLVIADEAMLAEALAKVQDCEAEYTIERWYKRRTARQNSALWGLVIPRVQRYWSEKERRAWTADWTHEFLKCQFYDPRLLDPPWNYKGTIVNGLILGASTRQLKSWQFVEYIDRICDFAAVAWDGLYIPPPDPLWRQKVEAEKQRWYMGDNEVPFDDLEDNDAGPTAN